MRRRGTSLIETVLLVPVLVLLFVGAMEMGKIALTYYTLHKGMRAAARMASVLRGADFCNQEDPQLLAIKEFLVNGPVGDAEPAPLVRDLTADQILITPERADPENGTIAECECAGASGCLAAEGGRAPDYVVVSIPDGYPFQPRIPFRTLDPVLLRPRVRAPFGGL
jgi:hypothetical protein